MQMSLVHIQDVTEADSISSTLQTAVGPADCQ